MNRNIVSSKATFVVLILALFLALASLGTQGCADAASSNGGAKAIEGVWTGVTSDPSSASITLTVRPSDGTLRYGSPRNCELILEEPSSAGGSVQKFGILSSTGGRCNTFLMGKLSVSSEGNADEIVYKVTDSNNKVVESGRLRRSSR